MPGEVVGDAYLLVPDEHGDVRVVEELALFDSDLFHDARLIDVFDVDRHSAFYQAHEFDDRPGTRGWRPVADVETTRV